MSEEGYVKYQCEWIVDDPVPYHQISELNRWRNKLYQLGLIGVYENGIGYGNISQRLEGDQFIVSGTATGKLPELKSVHYTKVVEFNLKENTLVCHGPIKASSESMSHGVIYQENPGINAAIHIHDLHLWKKLLNKVPTTNPNVAYGTPAMANEIIRLFNESDVLEKKIFVMAGHEEGVFTFGKDLEEAGKVLLRNYKL